MRKTSLFYWLAVGFLVVFFTGCNTDTDTNQNEDNSTESIPEKNGPVHASNFSMTLDVGQKTLSVNWKEKSSAISEDNGTISVTVKTQGTHGSFTLDSDTLVYVCQVDGNFTDQGVLTLQEGNSTVDVTVSIDTLYWKQMAAGQYYTMAIKSNGTLWGWGANTYGQLGDGTTVNRSAPVQIGTDTHWGKVYAKFLHTMAIKTDGTLWGWGYNRYGALGNGTNTDNHIPTQEPSKSTNWMDVAIGYYHTVAVKSDGTLWASGRNNYGQLGDNTIIDQHIFVPILAAVTDWNGVATGYYHSVATRKDGTLWAWGHNNSGQLGDGNNADLHVPTQEVLGDTDWKSIACGYNHTLAIKTDGTLFGWGYNNYATIGDGARVAQNTPTQEASAATDWMVVDGGNYHSVAVKTDGTLFGWGYNNFGQLTSGLNAWRYAPESIDGDAVWNQVSASQYHTAALKKNGTLLIWGTIAGAQSPATE